MSGIFLPTQEKFLPGCYRIRKGFKGLEVRTIDGTDFIKSYNTINEVISLIRKERRPFLIHAKVPLLNHHTSGVRKEWYRDDLEEAAKKDPLPRLRKSVADGNDSAGRNYKTRKRSN